LTVRIQQMSDQLRGMGRIGRLAKTKKGEQQPEGNCF
jgi:hypothetical protein